MYIVAPNISLISDDPYYCGLRARVPNFVAKSKANKESIPSKRYSITQQQQHQQILMQQHMNMNHHQIHQHPMWHARSYESGIGRWICQKSCVTVIINVFLDSDAIESPYNQIYGRLPIPTRNYIPAQPRTMYIGEWDWEFCILHYNRVWGTILCILCLITYHHIINFI